MLPRLFSILLALPLTAQVVPPKGLRSFYQDKCARCHGPDGSGRSAAGDKLKGRDLTDPDWRRSAQDAKLRKVIQPE
jgi:mono/diheme cytochrome c family protein